MADKREHSVHVRLCDASDSMLEFLASAKGEDKSKIAADILRRSLLGEGHDLRVAAERFLRAGTTGRNGE
jgi:hypothetical protein